MAERWREQIIGRRKGQMQERTGGGSLHQIISAFVGEDDIIIRRSRRLREPDSISFRIPIFSDADRKTGRGCLCIEVISHQDGLCDVRTHLGDGIDAERAHYIKLIVGNRRTECMFRYVKSFLDDHGLSTDGTSITGTVIYMRAVNIHFIGAFRLVQAIVCGIIPTVTEDLAGMDDGDGVTEDEYIAARLFTIRDAIASSRRFRNEGN